ncbi:MAG: TonB-dependent receptor [Gammaproteobacteria bacterium]|nr:MAG: TonB-dependent receptor [Gammaproteobacteria bacterium]
MHTGGKSALALSMAVATALGFTAPATAQDSPTARSLDEIVVTARKREETLQSVPVAVTAFTREAIRTQRIQSIHDVALSTPGLVYQDINATLSLPVIRGLAQTTVTGDNNVGVFINGLYLANNRTLDVGIIDLERIEVIKGPQSALYGQNSFSGAINYITRRPSERFEAEVEGTVGSDELFELRAVVSGPLTDTLSGMVAVAWKEFDGTFSNQNPADSSNLQGYETKGITAALEFTPTDRFSARLFGYYVESENDLPAQYLVPNNCGVSAVGTPTFFCGSLPADGTFDLNTAGTFGRDAENLILSLDLSIALTDRWTLNSTSGYIRNEYSSYFDFGYNSAGVPLPIVNTGTGEPGTVLTNVYLGQGLGRFRDLSQELRLEYADDTLDVTLGGFWYDSERGNASIAAVDTGVLSAEQAFTTPLGFLFGTPDPINAPVLSNLTEPGVRTEALFGRVGYQATDRLRLSAELRWARERITLDRFLNFSQPVTVNANQSARFTTVTPRITADFQLTEDVMLYAVYAEGVRSGGFNASATIDAEQAYAPEENRSYELGLKSQWFDGNLTANLAVFHVDWKDLQLNSPSLDPDNLFAVVRNTGGVRARGIELETALRVADGMTVGLTYAYTDPKFKSGSVDLGLATFCGVDDSICPNGANVGGQQLGRTAKQQVSAFAQLAGALTPGWDWSFRADVSAQSKQPTNAINEAFVAGYGIVNGRVAVSSDRYEIALWSRNLFDKEYVTASSAQPRFHVGAWPDVTLGYGRIVGLSAMMRFGE